MRLGKTILMLPILFVFIVSFGVDVKAQDLEILKNNVIKNFKKVRCLDFEIARQSKFVLNDTQPLLNGSCFSCFVRDDVGNLWLFRPFDSGIVFGYTFSLLCGVKSPRVYPVQIQINSKNHTGILIEQFNMERVLDFQAIDNLTLKQIHDVENNQVIDWYFQNSNICQEVFTKDKNTDSIMAVTRRVVAPFKMNHYPKQIFNSWNTRKNPYNFLWAYYIKMSSGSDFDNVFGLIYYISSMDARFFKKFQRWIFTDSNFNFSIGIVNNINTLKNSIKSSFIKYYTKNISFTGIRFKIPKEKESLEKFLTELDTKMREELNRRVLSLLDIYKTRHKELRTLMENNMPSIKRQILTILDLVVDDSDNIKSELLDMQSIILKTTGKKIYFPSNFESENIDLIGYLDDSLVRDVPGFGHMPDSFAVSRNVLRRLKTLYASDKISSNERIAVGLYSRIAEYVFFSRIADSDYSLFEGFSLGKVGLWSVLNPEYTNCKDLEYVLRGLYSNRSDVTPDVEKLKNIYFKNPQDIYSFNRYMNAAKYSGDERSAVEILNKNYSVFSDSDSLKLLETVWSGYLDNDDKIEQLNKLENSFAWKHFYLAYHYKTKDLSYEMLNSAQKCLETSSNSALLYGVYILLADYFEYNKDGVLWGEGFDIDRCILFYRQALKFYPLSVKAHLRLATFYLKKNMSEQAMIEFKRLAQIDKKWACKNFHPQGIKPREFYPSENEYLDAISMNTLSKDDHNILYLAYSAKNDKISAHKHMKWMEENF